MLQRSLENVAGTPARRPRTVFRFGGFELRSESGELLKRGIRIRLQAKPLRVLEALLEKPGEVVTREELFKKLWMPGTFVDFENGLNTAANRLRSALGDSANAPHYIETLPKLGYRLMCPAVKLDQPERHMSSAESDVERKHRNARLSSTRTIFAAVERGATALWINCTARWGKARR